MINSDLYFSNLVEPVFGCLSNSDSEFNDFVWKITNKSKQKTEARFCRARKMRRIDGLFDEFGAALQFPYYFGENWPAFDECLADLSWLPADSYILCITSADLLLIEEQNESLEVLMRILNKVALGWMQDSAYLASMGRVPTPFHVLLQVTEKSRIIDYFRVSEVQFAKF